MSFTWSGLQQVEATLAELERNLQKNVEQATIAAVEDGLAVTNANTPVRTGHLKSRNKINVLGWKGRVFQVELANDASYAAIIELGARHRPPHPFIAPGMEMARRRLATYLAAFGVAG